MNGYNAEKVVLTRRTHVDAARRGARDRRDAAAFANGRWYRRGRALADRGGRADRAVRHRASPASASARGRGSTGSAAVASTARGRAARRAGRVERFVLGGRGGRSRATPGRCRFGRFIVEDLRTLDEVDDRRRPSPVFDPAACLGAGGSRGTLRERYLRLTSIATKACSPPPRRRRCSRRGACSRARAARDVYTLSGRNDVSGLASGSGYRAHSRYFGHFRPVPHSVGKQGRLGTLSTDRTIAPAGLIGAPWSGSARSTPALNDDGTLSNRRV